MAFQFTVYLCGICGVVMVCGAIWLLRTGVIRLSEAGKGGSFSVEVEKKIRVSTGYPALALFLIGLLFVLLALVFSKPKGVQPLNIVGKLRVDDPSVVTITIEPDLSETSLVFTPDSDGRLDKEFRPEVRQVQVLINAAGYTPQQSRFTLRVDQAKGQSLSLPDDLTFTKVANAPAAGSIAPLPAGAALPSLNQPAGF